MVTFVRFSVVVTSLLFASVFGNKNFDFTKQYAFAHNTFHELQTANSAVTTQFGFDAFVPVQAYNNPSISELLANGICGFEFDIFPKGDNDNPNDPDFQVKHYDIYDEVSTCSRFGDCLLEISNFLNSQTVECAIWVKVQVNYIDQFTNNDFKEIEDIIKNSLNNNQLYTPKDHKAKATDTIWPDWTNPDDINKWKIKNGQVFITISSTVIDALYPNAINVSNNCGGINYENNGVLFARCSPGGNDNRYCVIGGDETENKNKYPIVGDTSNTILFQSLSECPVSVGQCINYASNMDDTTVTIKNIFGVGNDGSLGWREWNVFMLLSYMDALGNNNGKIDIAEVGAFTYETNQRNVAKQAAAETFAQQLIDNGLDDILSLAHLNILGAASGYPPDAYLVLTVLANTFITDFDGITPTIDFLAVIDKTCDALDSNALYLITDYAYQYSTYSIPLQYTLKYVIDNKATLC